MELSERWQRIFADLAKTIAKASKDPSTKVGAVIYRPNKSVASMGFNGLPATMTDDPVILNNREEKLKHMVHAEINALDYMSVDDYFRGENLGMVCTFLPCADCAKEIVAFCDIKTVYYLKASKEAEERWVESFKETRRLFAEAGIKAIEIDESILD